MADHLRVTVDTLEQVDLFCAALIAELPNPARPDLSSGLGGPQGGYARTDPRTGLPLRCSTVNMGANVVFALEELGVWAELARDERTVRMLADRTGADVVKLLSLLRVAALLGHVSLTDNSVSLTQAGRSLPSRPGTSPGPWAGTGSCCSSFPSSPCRARSFGREVSRDGRRIAACFGPGRQVDDAARRAGGRDRPPQNRWTWGAGTRRG